MRRTDSANTKVPLNDRNRSGCTLAAARTSSRLNSATVAERRALPATLSGMLRHAAGTKSLSDSAATRAPHRLRARSADRPVHPTHESRRANTRTRLDRPDYDELELDGCYTSERADQRQPS